MAGDNIMSKHSLHTTPYKVSTEEVKQSLNWLENEHRTKEYHIYSYIGGQRSEVREGRFHEHMIPEIVDSDVVSKFNRAQAIDTHKISH